MNDAQHFLATSVVVRVTENVEIQCLMVVCEIKMQL